MWICPKCSKRKHESVGLEKPRCACGKKMEWSDEEVREVGLLPAVSESDVLEVQEADQERGAEALVHRVRSEHRDPDVPLQVHSLKFVHDDGGRAAAGFKGTAGDCVCRAIVIASGRPYREVYDALAHGNATQRRSSKEARSGRGVKTAREGISVTRQWFKDYMKSLGFVWTPTMLLGQGCKVHLAAGELPPGRLVVSVSKHYTAVIDGVVHDIYNPQRETGRCVYGYWRLES